MQQPVQQALDPPRWSSWRPYQPPAETDTLGWRWVPEEARQFGLVPPTRWMAVDPLSEKHPDWTPYHYVLGNPMLLVDPDGQQEAYYNRARDLRALSGPEGRAAVRQEMRELYPVAKTMLGFAGPGGTALALMADGATGELGLNLSTGLDLGGLGLDVLTRRFGFVDEILEGLGDVRRAADAFSDLPHRGTIDPSKIRFSQNSISPTFKDPQFGSVNDLAQKLRDAVLEKVK